MERVASVCNELLLVETETALNFLPFPAARLWPGRELGNDETNWWSFNRAALVALLRGQGFQDVRIVYQTPLIRRVARALVKERKAGRSFRAGLRSTRLVIHAHR